MNLTVDMNTAPFARPLVEIQAPPIAREEPNLSHSLRKDSSVIPAVSTSPQHQQAARRLWWQKSIVRRSFATIEKEVHNLISSSPYLQKHYSCDHDVQQQQRNHFLQRGIAKFHRNEIITGPILGKGGFSQVMEIVAFQLLPEVSQQCTAEEQALRQQYVSTSYDTSIGKYRYCIKHLQEKIVRGSNGCKSSSALKKNDEFQLAASDLYMESVTLSVLHHENIIPVRGLPIHGIQSWKTGLYDSYFIIMDQLSTTLDKKIEEWKSGRTSSVSDNTPAILQEKAQCAYQLALALQYIHSNRLLYRDLKPQNIGFSLQDTNKIQLFDFGLCRELPSSRTSRMDENEEMGADDVYEMSGVGTRRYMAPEIVTIGQYNQKADVYSWSMVFYELLTCIKPYVTYTTEDHTTHVCYENERPNLPFSFPYWIHRTLQNAWDENISKRSTINDVCQHLQVALLKCTGDCGTTESNDNTSRERKDINHELYITNHDSLISKEFALPNSPTGVHDFPIMSNKKETRVDSTYSAMTYTNDGNDESESSQSFHAESYTETKLSVADTTVNCNECENQESMRFQDAMIDLTTIDFMPPQSLMASGTTTLVCDSCMMSPPPAPKRPPTVFVQVPDDLVRTFELSLSDDDHGDDDVQNIEEVRRITV